MRGHHVLCLLTFVGRGYTPAFIAAVAALAAHVRGGGAITLIEGPDVLCDGLRAEGSAAAAHCAAPRNRRRDRVALRGLARVLTLRPARGAPDAPGGGSMRQADAARLRPGTTLILDRATRSALRQHFAADGAGTTGLRRACRGCEWQALCTDVAAGGYAATHLSGSIGDSSCRRRPGLNVEPA